MLTAANTYVNRGVCVEGGYGTEVVAMVSNCLLFVDSRCLLFLFTILFYHFLITIQFFSHKCQILHIKGVV